MAEKQLKPKTTRKTVTKKPAVTSNPKRVSAKTSSEQKKSPMGQKEFKKMVSEAAYYRAEKRGFVGGDQNEDWLIAEIEVKRLLNL